MIMIKNKFKYILILSIIILFVFFIRFLFSPYIITQYYIIKTVGDCKELDEVIKRACVEVEKKIVCSPLDRTRKSDYKFFPSLKFVRLYEDTEKIGKNRKLVITINEKDKQGIYRNRVEMFRKNRGTMQRMGKSKLNFYHEKNIPYTNNEIEKRLTDGIITYGLKFNCPTENIPFLIQLKLNLLEKIYNVPGYDEIDWATGKPKKKNI